MVFIFQFQILYKMVLTTKYVMDNQKIYIYSLDCLKFFYIPKKNYSLKKFYNLYLIIFHNLFYSSIKRFFQNLQCMAQP